MRVLITGITGFAGSHLAEYILANHPDVEVFGIVRWRSRMDNIAPILDKIRLIEADLKDMVSLEVRPGRVEARPHLPPRRPELRPDVVEVPGRDVRHQRHRRDQPVRGGAGPEASSRRSRSPARARNTARSSPNEIPMKETNPLRPLSPYAVSKVAQDLLAFQYYKSYGLRTVRTRGFNHTGPRRGDVFVTSSFAKQIAEIEKKKRPPVINVGNLEAKRDFTDVRDMVRAYWLALEKRRSRARSTTSGAARRSR